MDEVRLGVGLDDVRRSESLFQDHYRPVVQVCLRYLHDLEDAEDAAQEVFSRAVREGDKLVGDIRPWLITVARRICLDELRRRKTHLAVVAESSGATSPDPEQVVLSRVFLEQLLSRLTSAERRVVTHTLIEDRTHVDSARSLGIKSSTTRVLLSRARRKLHDYLLREAGVKVGSWLVAAGAATAALRRRLSPAPDATPAMAAAILPVSVLVALVIGGTPTAIPGAAAGWGLGPSQAPPTRAGVAPSDQQALARPVAVAIRLAPAAGSSRVNRRSGGSSQLLPLPPQDVSQSANYVAASPDYEQDHTLYASGLVNGCTPPPCYALFRSTDGGQSWARTVALGLAGVEVLVPRGSAASRRFYAFGQAGLQVTTDDGTTFRQLDAGPGYATAPPAWSGLEAMVSNAGLVGFDATGLVAREAFNAGQIASGRPAFVASASGDFVLQPALPAASIGPQPTTVLRCSATCKSIGTLPWSGPTQMVTVGRNSVVAFNPGGGAALSRDYGTTFDRFSLPDGTGVDDLQAMSSGRLIAWMRRGLDSIPYWSDDLGNSWFTADISRPRADSVLMVNSAVVSSTSAIAAVTSMADNNEHRDLYCTLDAGRSWAPCASNPLR